MSGITIDQLGHVLSNTFDTTGPQRTESEQQLIQLEQLPGILPLYFQLLDQSNISLAIKQSCCIRIKNIVNEYWYELDSLNNNNKNSSIIINQNDRQYIKSIIYHKIQSTSEPLLKNQLLECCYIIIKYDFPEQWNSLYEQIINDLNQSLDHNALYNSVFILKLIFKRYQYKSEDKRQPLYSIIESIFPRLYDIASIIINTTTNNHTLNKNELNTQYILLQKICKIFFISIQLYLPQYLRNTDILDQWILLYQHILIHINNPVVQSIDDEPELHALEKCKKNSAQILNRLITIYGQPKTVSKSLKSTAAVIENKYSVSILNTFLQLLHYKSDNKYYIHPRVLHISYIYISTAIKYSKLWLVILPNIEWLITKSIFTTVAMTQYEIDEFNNNSIEFLDLTNDMAEEFYDPKVQAKQLLYDLIRIRKRHTYQLTMSYIIHIFQQYQSNQTIHNAIAIESAIHIFGTLHKLLMSEPNNIQQIESIIYQFILPSINSSYTFLTFRSITVFGEYYKLTYNVINQTNNINIQQMICAHLYQLLQHGNQHIPVQYSIFYTISKLLHNKQYVELIRAISTELFHYFFQLCEKYINESVIQILDQLINTYSNEIIPHAIQIITHLKTMYYNIINVSDINQITDSSSMTGNECIRTMTSMCFILGESTTVDKSIFYTVESNLIDLINTILSNEKYIEFFDELCELVTCITYYIPSFSPSFYNILQQLFVIGATWASDYTSEICGIIDNYICKDNYMFLTNASPNYLTLLIQFGTRIINDHTREADAQHVIVLYESLLSNCTIDQSAFNYQLIDYLLDIIISHLHTVKKPMNKYLLLDLFCICVYYNPVYVSTKYSYWAEQSNLYKIWFESHNKIKHSYKHMKSSILGLISLLQLTNEQLPVPLRNTHNQLLNGTMKLLLDIKNVEHDNKHNADEEDIDEVSDDGNHSSDDDIDDSDNDEYLNSARFIDLEDTQDEVSQSVTLSDTENEMNSVDNSNHTNNVVDINSNKINTNELDEEEYDDVDEDEYELDYDDFDEEEYINPLDKIDELILFSTTMNTIQSQQSHIYTQWIRSLTKSNAKKYKTLMLNAAKRQQELNQNINDNTNHTTTNNRIQINGHR